ncbi:predicted protein [Uncinocarpus reesii 1704]|uniref:Uncharacterized protein n=1 Tax=Uncinocarpus reesii (strain UAMH 1704) TaxID=336963 RepID=C4JZ61_UNCRE|nr:uncharacterized protein UREG_07462 [Uncinocarpus reesii 1704]EEP82597.1 predicted protein [Uncinocarpus reesii 1704]
MAAEMIALFPSGHTRLSTYSAPKPLVIANLEEEQYNRVDQRRPSLSRRITQACIAEIMHQKREWSYWVINKLREDSEFRDQTAPRLKLTEPLGGEEISVQSEQAIIISLDFYYFILAHNLHAQTEDQAEWMVLNRRLNTVLRISIHPISERCGTYPPEGKVKMAPRAHGWGWEAKYNQLDGFDPLAQTETDQLPGFIEILAYPCCSPHNHTQNAFSRSDRRERCRQASASRLIRHQDCQPRSWESLALHDHHITLSSTPARIFVSFFIPTGGPADASVREITNLHLRLYQSHPERNGGRDGVCLRKRRIKSRGVRSPLAQEFSAFRHEQNLATKPLLLCTKKLVLVQATEPRISLIQGYSGSATDVQSNELLSVENDFADFTWNIRLSCVPYPTI